jgi:hypothetical protein
MSDPEILQTELVGEVESSIRAVQIPSGGVVGTRGFLRGSKAPKVLLNTTLLDRRLPPLANPRHAFVPRGVVSLAAAIPDVFAPGADAEIASTVVEFVAVDVVGVRPRRGVSQPSVQVTPPVLERLVRVDPGVRPPVVEDARGVNAVNDGDFASGEKDESDTIGAHSVLLTLDAAPGVFAAPPGISSGERYRV